MNTTIHLIIRHACIEVICMRNGYTQFGIHCRVTQVRQEILRAEKIAHEMGLEIDWENSVVGGLRPERTES